VRVHAGDPRCAPDVFESILLSLIDGGAGAGGKGSLAAEPSSGFEMYRASAAPWCQSGPSLRRLVLIIGVGAVVIILLAIRHGVGGNADSFPAPSKATLAGLSLRQRIVVIATSQVGYRTDPSNSYCDKFSAYWDAGATDCPSGERDEEWCADFAAWAWQQAGVHVTYGYRQGEINGGAVSFYEWGVANGKWHPATKRYVAAPGDVAVYGLSLGADPSAAHVAIVTKDTHGQRGPQVVNGDGDRTGYSVVETGTDQVRVHATHGDFTLAGYVSPS